MYDAIAGAPRGVRANGVFFCFSPSHVYRGCHLNPASNSNESIKIDHSTHFCEFVAMKTVVDFFIFHAFNEDAENVFSVLP